MSNWLIYEPIKQEEYDDVLKNIANQDGVDKILEIPGIMDLLTKHYNERVLTIWERVQPWEVEQTEAGAFVFSQDEFELIVAEDHWKKNRVYLTYELRDYNEFELSGDPSDEGVLIFHGKEFSPSPMDPPLSLKSIACLLSFLSLEEGDTDPEIFEPYTPLQIAWRDARASDLKLVALDLEESLG